MKAALLEAFMSTFKTYIGVEVEIRIRALVLL